MFGRKQQHDDFAIFAMLTNALGGGGNVGAIMPEDDAIDLRNGAEYIPYEVTDARRLGRRIIYLKDEKAWQIPDGSKVK